MKNYIANAFSLQMLSELPASIKVEKCTEEEALSKENTSVVGHPDTARVMGVPFNRVSVKVNKGDVVYVAQVIGGRLPEGCTTLPEGFSMVFLKVTIG